MVAPLQELDPVSGNSINEAVFLSDASTPTPCQHKSKWFRLADACERIAQDCFNQIEHTNRRLSIRLHPKSEIFPELREEYRDALSALAHETTSTL